MGNKQTEQKNSYSDGNQEMSNEEILEILPPHGKLLPISDEEIRSHISCLFELREIKNIKFTKPTEYAKEAMGVIRMFREEMHFTEVIIERYNEEIDRIYKKVKDKGDDLLRK